MKNLTTTVFVRWMALGVLAFCLALSSTARAADDASIGAPVGSTIVPDDVTAKDVQAALLKAFIGRGWEIKEKTDSKVVAYLNNHGHEATLTALFDSKKFDLYCVGYRVKKTGERVKPEIPESWIKHIKTDTSKYLVGVHSGK